MTKSNAPMGAVEGTHIMEKDISKVGCVSTRMKPCDLEKQFEGSVEQVINPFKSMISHGNLVGFFP